MDKPSSGTLTRRWFTIKSLKMRGKSAALMPMPVSAMSMMT
jgi:hypothetical protein